MAGYGTEVHCDPAHLEAGGGTTSAVRMTSGGPQEEPPGSSDAIVPSAHQTPGNDAAATASPTWARQETLPPTAPPDAGTGTPLGSRYLLDEVIGTGATGRVWRARRREDGLPVAVKVLREEFSASADAVVRFLRERTTLRSLQHPYLVRVHDLVVEGDTLAIVMDLVTGEDLRALVGRGAITREQVLVVLHQVSAALAAVHAAGVVHRDVKPENVLVDFPSGAAAGPRARLTDFGLAWAGDGPLVTRASQLVGTPAYVAPELVAGRRAGQPSDVYAFGIMAYELLAGRRPFHAEHTAALLRAHLDTEPPRPPDFPDDLWAVVGGCLAKRPEDRPAAVDLAYRFAELAGVSGAHQAQAPAIPGNLPPTPPGRTTADLASPADPTDQSQVHSQVQSQAGSQTASALTSGVLQAQPTTGATRPAAEPPEPPKPRSRRWLIVTVLAVCVVVGVAAGIWAGQPAPKPKPHHTAKSTVQQYFLEVFATTPSPGKVTLRFTDMADRPGFDSYVVFRDGFKLQQVGPGQSVPPYPVSGVDTKSEHCYTVVALVVTRKPPPSPAPKPACLVADGKSR